MNKKAVLRSLCEDVYCRLKPSSIHGVGVFAIRDIPKGVNPFQNCDDSEAVAFMPGELAAVHPAVVRYLKDICVYRKRLYYVPACGLNRIDQSYYLNHSKAPNMAAQRGGQFFVAVRDIPAGEELTVDYDTYDRDQDDFRK